MNATCSKCGEVKPGAVVASPASDLQGGVVGGQVVRAGETPGPPFLCFDCAPWQVLGEPVEEPPTADRERRRYTVARGTERRDVIVEISGTLAASDPNRLPSPLDEAVASRGRSALAQRLARVEPPESIYISTAGVQTRPRDPYYEPGDRVVFQDGGVWHGGTFDARGEPADAVAGDDGRPHDVGWVLPDAGGPVERYVYSHIRAKRPD